MSATLFPCSIPGFGLAVTKMLLVVINEQITSFLISHVHVLLLTIYTFLYFLLLFMNIELYFNDDYEIMFYYLVICKDSYRGSPFQTHHYCT